MESGNGDRAAAARVEPTSASAATPIAAHFEPADVAASDASEPRRASGDFERLKHILVGDEVETIAALDARVGAIDRVQRALPSRLPEAIEHAQRGAGAERMADALARPVTHALGAAVRENKQVIIDVLFPVIGPAIRKAIAEALRTLVADLNGAIESSFTPKGLRWRFEAWRSGVPYAQIVLKHTLRYAIDHVFLIERGSGLVIDRESAPDLPPLDSDAIAGMLTAIGEFVRDSVDRDGAGTLESARVGEHLLWVVQGPRVNLACFLRGVPPASLHAVLEQRLENVHARLDEGEGAADEWRAALKPEALVRDARADEDGDEKKSSRGPLLVVALAVLALLAWWFVRHQQSVAALDALRARLESHPGFVLSGIDRRDGGLIVRGLLDPDAEPLDATLAGATPAKADTTGYVSTDDAVVARRARRLLDAPSGVTLAANDGVLTLGGHAAGAWIDAARQRAAWVPGVRSVVWSVAPDTDPKAIARAGLDALATSMPSRLVAFTRDTELAAGADATLDDVANAAHRAEALAQTAGTTIEWIAVGANDDPGSNAINARLREMRARWLADALTSRGIARVRVAPDDDASGSTLRQRAAFVRLVVGEAAR